MKKTFILLLLFLLSFEGMPAQSTRKAQYLRPTIFQKKVTHLIAEKSRSYYSLSIEKPSTITVRGPGILRVMTRGRFVPGEGETINYTILYTIDGAEPKTIKMNGKLRSKKATYLKGSLGVPGQLEDFEIKLGRGYHTLEFKRNDNKIAVAARYKFTPTKEKKQEWIAYSPLQPAEMVDLISKEKIIHYCRFSSDKPLKVEVNGPSQLRVLTRIENHYQMKGRIHYRLQVKENNKVINTYQLSSRRSEVAVYKSNNELIPGKACEFVIEVPKGNHNYEIVPLDEDKNSILGRLLLPLKDIKLKK